MKNIIFFITGLFIVVQSSHAQFTSGGQPMIGITNIIPKSPQSDQLIKINEANVNLAKGVPEISVPLFNAHVGKISIPVMLQYDASGIRYDDIPSSVGLKWTLNAGGEVSRSINGKPDENDYFIHASGLTYDSVAAMNLYTTDVQDFLAAVANNTKDISHDQYSYNYPGMSGYFYFRNNKFIDCRNPGTLKIESDSISPAIHRFTFTDDQGNQSWFGGSNTDFSITSFSGSGYLSPNVPPVGTTAWKMYKIHTYTNEEATFEYDTLSYSTTKLSDQSYTLRHEADEATSYKCNCGTSTFNDNTITNVFAITVIKAIHTPSEDVTFYYSRNNGLDIYKQRLDSLVVQNKTDNAIIKRVHLHYDMYSTVNLLKLTDVWTMGNDGSDSILTASFHYIDGSLPGINSNARDLFNYNNGAINTTLLSSSDSDCPGTYNADRTVSNSNIVIGTIDTIYYATTGKVAYAYSANVIGSLYAPGIKVDSIAYINNDNSIAGKTLYTYSEMQSGYNFYGHADNTKPLDASSCPGKIFNSEIERTPPASPHFYGNIEIRKKASTSGNTQLTKEYYAGFMDGYYILRPVIVQKKYFKNNDLSLALKIENYSYLDESIDTMVTEQLRPGVAALPSQVYILDGDHEIDNTNSCNLFYYAAARTALLEPRNNLLNKKETIEYDQNNGTSTISTSINSGYNDNWQKISDSKINSKGLTDSAFYTYLYTNAGSLSSSVLAANLFAAVNKTQHYINASQVEQSRVHFGLQTEGTILPDSFLIKRLGTVDITDKVVTRYDSIGQAAELFEKGGFYSSFLRGYNRQLITAYIKNARLNDVAYTSFETDSTGNWSGLSNTPTPGASPTGSKYYPLTGSTLQKSGLDSTSTYIVSYWSSTGNYFTVSGTVASGKKGAMINGWTYCEQEITGTSTISVSGSGNIDELRLYPKGALMTTYTYLPSIGLSSETDAANKITYYEYDGFGRLARLKDQYGNILKAFDYKYNQ